jgi:hypothetical protein
VTKATLHDELMREAGFGSDGADDFGLRALLRRVGLVVEEEARESRIAKGVTGLLRRVRRNSEATG